MYDLGLGFRVQSRMGKARTSRKGKKAWRKNISTSDADELVERTGRDERSGGPLDATSNEALFFVDKSGDETLQKKIFKHRNKVLHCDSVLQRNSLVPPLPAPSKRKIKDKDIAKPPKKRPALPKTEDRPSKKAVSNDLWAEEANSGSNRLKEKSSGSPSLPAVEIDVPGCSYNPTFEDHQEALGVALAQEMQHVYKKELQPEPIALCVPGTVIDDEDLFFLEADQEDVGEDEENVETGLQVSRAVKNAKLTKTDLNKRARKRHLLKVEAERKKRAKLKEEIVRISEIKENIKLEDEEKQKLWTRRMVSKQERLATCPPRLGRHKFKPEPVRVLLTEEVTGSLRKLKGCYLLLRERFKSLQRRGLVEPRVPVKKKARKMWVEYEPGTKGTKEREMHAAMQAELGARKHALSVVPLT